MTLPFHFETIAESMCRAVVWAVQWWKVYGYLLLEERIVEYDMVAIRTHKNDERGSSKPHESEA